jgi:DNA-binding NtrC family response regulator
MRILIVGTMSGQLATASKIAFDRGAKVTHAADIDHAMKIARAQGADLAMVDVRMDIGKLSVGLETEHICLPIVACGVETDAAAAVSAIKAGAKEYIPLPPDEELIAAVIAAVADESATEMVVRDAAMQSVVRLAEQIAPSDASVLVTGESGTGKEVMARHIHTKSRRASKPFISVNCAAIPEHLLESELFGHEKGSFTGATARRIGKFEEANTGTLLLDEISEMDVRLQAKLLRAIQERVIDRVGGTRPVPVDIRIIATSNRNLAEAVKEGSFREDLLYRLNVVNLKLPALRDRPQDILALADHFSAKYAEANFVEHKAFSEQAKALLVSSQWPGNVRELENAIHRAVLLAQDPQIEADALRSPDGEALEPMIGRGAPGADIAAHAARTAETVSRSLVGRTVADVERDLILETLDHCVGNRTHAANVLGISIRTLRNKLNQYSGEGLDVAAPGERRQVETRLAG